MTSPSHRPPDPTSDVVLDSRSLRGIAHPLRVELLRRLREDGPSTASRLAEKVNTSSGATSYHLRQLALYGFIVEDETPTGSARQPRERWWRAAHRSTQFDTSAVVGDPADEASAEVYLRSVVQAYARRMVVALEEGPSLPEWRDTGTFSDWSFVLDPSRTTELLDEMAAVLQRYAVEPELEPTDGRRPVTVQLQVFPRPGWTPREES
jgi:predicted ArsR family transcriptional regulator